MQLCTAKGPVAASWAGEGSAAQSSPGMPFGSHQASQIPGGPWSAFRDQSQAGAPEQSRVVLRFASEEVNEKLFLICARDAMRIGTTKEAFAAGYCRRTLAVAVVHNLLLFIVVVQNNLRLFCCSCLNT